MICYKCGDEMYPVFDSAWRRHRDGTRSRRTEFVCAECRVYAALDVSDYENCTEVEEIIKQLEEEDKE